jgi:hypothetical protein
MAVIYIHVYILYEHEHSGGHFVQVIVRYSIFNINFLRNNVKAYNFLSVIFNMIFKGPLL